MWPSTETQKWTVCCVWGQWDIFLRLSPFSSIMAEVYSPTTVPNPKSSWFIVPSQHLDKTRFGVKVCEVVSSHHSVWSKILIQYQSITHIRNVFMFQRINVDDGTIVNIYFQLIWLVLMKRLINSVTVSLVWQHIQVLNVCLLVVVFLVNLIIILINKVVWSLTGHPQMFSNQKSPKSSSKVLSWHWSHRARAYRTGLWRHPISTSTTWQWWG